MSNESLGSCFARSFRRRCEEGWFGADLSQDVDSVCVELVQLAANEGKDLELSKVVYPELFKQCGFNAYDTLDVAIKACQSPIEILLFLSIVVSGTDRFVDVWINPRGSRWEPRLDAMYELLIIEPQAQIGVYHADFLVSLDSRTESGGRERHQVVVECDGHDFHEKTKAQASHDRRRDRVMQGSGLSVLRFTGSDIWSDCFKCADEVLSFLTSRRTFK